jgi:hypothetical protein
MFSFIHGSKNYQLLGYSVMKMRQDANEHLGETTIPWEYEHFPDRSTGRPYEEICVSIVSFVKLYVSPHHPTFWIPTIHVTKKNVKW